MEFDNSRPIWLQLTEEFARRIAVGSWQPGMRLPGVRELANELGVNPNTVQRSLAELERDGLCRAERTAGRFVTDDAARITELREGLVSQSADGFIETARGLSLDRDQTISLIERRWQHPAEIPQVAAPQATEKQTIKTDDTADFTREMPGGGL